MIPRNLVEAIPTTTELPMLFIAFMARSSLLPVYLMKFIPMWLQNSTPKPIDVTRLTTKTAFISIGYPPITMLNIQQTPISWKKTIKTQKDTIRAILKLARTCMATIIAPIATNTFWNSTPLMYVY